MVSKGKFSIFIHKDKALVCLHPLSRLKHEVLELATYASEELTVDNYDISTGPHFMRWAAQLHQIVNEMKAYRNTPN